MRIRAFLTVVVLAPLLSAAPPEKPSGCSATYNRTHFHSAARSAYSRPFPLSRKLATVRKIVRCQRKPASKRIVRFHLGRYKAGHHRRFYWRIAYSRLSSSDKGWAIRTGACESHNNPRTNTGNSFYGAFQFTLPTSRAAGFRARPDLTSWHEQAVRAVRWRNQAGRGQWPVCG